jgi:hypothetical protein
MAGRVSGLSLPARPCGRGRHQHSPHRAPGAKLAHSLPVGKLKKIFAFLLLAMGTKMLWPS